MTKTLEIKMDATVVAECIFFIQSMAFDNVCIHLHMVEGTSNRGVASSLQKG